MAAEFATKLEVSSDALEYFLNLRKPQFRLTDVGVEVGRAALPRLSTEKRGAGAAAFAPTRACLTLMESIMQGIQNGEALLLTGETGIGKTFVVQVRRPSPPAAPKRSVLRRVSVSAVPSSPHS